MSLSGTAISYDSTKIQIEESDEGKIGRAHV